ncbi:MAG TPA: hypothetical protein VIO60_09940, partial [Rectinemataceae bacterium]
TSMQAADLAYANGRYVPAKGLAEDVSATLSDDFQASVASQREAAAAKAAADPAMADARTRMVWAENNEIKKDYPAEYKQASTSMQAAELAYANGRYVPAKGLAEDVSATLSDDFQKKVLDSRKPVEPAPPKPSEPTPTKPTEPVKASETPVEPAKTDVPATPVTTAAPVSDEAKQAAQAQIDKAQAKYDWAVSVNAANNYPAELGSGSALLGEAKAAFAAGDYAAASAKAGAAYETLSKIGQYALLPAKYVVRLIPERRDCLWRIAEYAFVYNNPLKWPVLYEANKKTFKDPSNPDLIFPGQVLVIPSIKGEKREGTWDPKKTYQALTK